MNSDALPLVSVIIPVYNAEKYIEDCIFSVINQNYSRLEIISLRREEKEWINT